MDTNYSDNNQISKYNDAGLSIMRLNEHWIHCEHYLNSGNLIKAKFRLDGAERELWPDMVKLSEGNKRKQAKELLKLDSVLKQKIAKENNRAKLYFFLHERYKVLRLFQDLCGKAGVYADEHADLHDSA